jgi:allantoinase
LQFDLVVANGTVVTAEGRAGVDIGIAGGVIAAIAAPGQIPADGAAARIDASGLCALPGLIDVHVHLFDPGWPEWEDFPHGTRAAAAGGITTIFEMPVSRPPVDSAEVFAARLHAVKGRAVVDFALYGGLGETNGGAAAGMARAGAIGFKTFRARGMAGKHGAQDGIRAPDPGAMLERFRESAATGLPHAVHAEHDRLAEHFKAEAIARGWTRPEHHNLGRPELCEIVSTVETLALARAARARLHVVHMSAPDAVEAAARARDSGQAVTLETCPQYLLFSSDDMARFGAYGKVHPPLRGPESRDRLWEYVTDGTIDVIASDHSPFPASDKAPYEDDIWGAAGGHPGLETMLPGLLTQVNAGKITLERLAALTSENPARIFGLHPRKGSMTLGADADLVLIDLGATDVVRPERMFTKARTAERWFDGASVQGKTVTTIVRGVPVFDRGRIVVEPGHGRFVRPGQLA